jgi:hypothetical protein
MQYWIHALLIGARATLVMDLWGSLRPALLVGIVTVAAPFLVMQPGMGAGIAASRTPKPAVARINSLLTHAIFGLGLYLAALATSRLLKNGH